MCFYRFCMHVCVLSIYVFLLLFPFFSCSFVLFYFHFDCFFFICLFCFLNRKKESKELGKDPGRREGQETTIIYIHYMVKIISNKK